MSDTQEKEKQNEQIESGTVEISPIAGYVVSSEDMTDVYFTCTPSEDTGYTVNMRIV